MHGQQNIKILVYVNLTIQAESLQLTSRLYLILCPQIIITVNAT